MLVRLVFDPSFLPVHHRNPVVNEKIAAVDRNSSAAASNCAAQYTRLVAKNDFLGGHNRQIADKTGLVEKPKAD